MQKKLNLRHIDDTIVEGKLLMAALAKLTTTLFKDQTPDDVLNILGSDVNKMYSGHSDETRAVFRKAQNKMLELRDLVDSMENDPKKVALVAEQYGQLMIQYNEMAKHDEIHRPRHPWLQMKSRGSAVPKSGTPIAQIQKLRETQAQLRTVIQKKDSFTHPVQILLMPILQGLDGVMDEMVEQIKKDTGYQEPEKKDFATGGHPDKMSEETAAKVLDKIKKFEEWDKQAYAGHTGVPAYDKNSIWYQATKAGTLLEVEKWARRVLEVLKKADKDKPFLENSGYDVDLKFALSRLEKTLEESVAVEDGLTDKIVDHAVENLKNEAGVSSEPSGKSTTAKQMDGAEIGKAMEKLSRELLDDSMIMHKDEVKQLYYIRDLANDAAVRKLSGKKDGLLLPEDQTSRQVMEKIAWAVAEHNNLKSHTDRGPGFFKGDIISAEHYNRLLSIAGYAQDLLTFRTMGKIESAMADTVFGNLDPLIKALEKANPNQPDRKEVPAAHSGTDYKYERMSIVCSIAQHYLDASWDGETVQSRGPGAEAEALARQLREALKQVYIGFMKKEPKESEKSIKNANQFAAVRVDRARDVPDNTWILLDINSAIMVTEAINKLQGMIYRFGEADEKLSEKLRIISHSLHNAINGNGISDDPEGDELRSMNKMTDIPIRQLEAYVQLHKSALDVDAVFKGHQAELKIPGDLGTAMMHLRTVLQSMR